MSWRCCSLILMCYGHNRHDTLWQPENVLKQSPSGDFNSMMGIDQAKLPLWESLALKGGGVYSGFHYIMVHELQSGAAK